MPFGPLPICQYPIYVNGTQNGNDLNPSSNTFISDCLHERFTKKIRNPFYRQSCHSFPQTSRFGSDTKKQELYLLGNDIIVLPDENNSYMDFFPLYQKGSKAASNQTSPLRYQAIQELLKHCSGNIQDQPHEVSSGYFKEQVVIKFRRALYFSGFRVLYVRGGGFYRHVSADYFLRNPNCLQRLIPWLKRELIAIYGDYGYTAKNILTIILQNMTKHDLDSQTFSEILGPYLLQFTEHFLHEFISFARSPFNMKTYDQRAIYECPSPSNGRGNLFTISPTNDKWALPTLENYTDMAKTIHDTWNKEILPHSSSDYDMTSEISEEPLEEPTRTRNKHHLRTQIVSESGDSKGVISSQSYIHTSHLKSMGGDAIGLLESDSKRYTSEGKTEGRKLQFEQDKCLGENRTNLSTSDISTTLNSNPREKNLLDIYQTLTLKTQEKEPEKNKNLNSLGKIFRRNSFMLKEAQPLSGNTLQKKDQILGCNSENGCSHRRLIQRDQRVNTLRKEILNCQPFCQGGELSSQTFRRLKSSLIRDPQSLKQGLPQSTEDKPVLSHHPKKRRSRSRDHSEKGLKESYTSEPLLTISCEAQEGDKGDGDYQLFRRTVLASTRELISPRVRDQHLCNREKAFRVKSPSVCLHPENHRPNCQCLKKSGTLCEGIISSQQEKMGKKRRFKSQHSEKENNEIMANSFPAPVQMHQIQQSSFCCRSGLPKCISPTAQAPKDSLNHTIVRQEKCDQKLKAAESMSIGSS